MSKFGSYCSSDTTLCIMCKCMSNLKIRSNTTREKEREYGFVVVTLYDSTVAEFGVYFE